MDSTSHSQWFRSLPKSSEAVTSGIIKVPSVEDLKKGARIEVIKPDQLPPQPPKK